MATESKQKHRLAVKNPQRAGRIIEDLMLDNEELTTAELYVELRRIGVDPDECLNKVLQEADKIARDPNRLGHVSPHVSEVMSQLSQRHRSEAKATASEEPSVKKDDTRSVSVGITQKARAAVRTSYRNYNKTSEKDRKILEGGERFLKEKAKKLSQKKTKG